MNEVTRKILLLSCCNILWGLIPWPAYQLFNEYSSFTIIFSRFLIMTGVMLFIAIFLLIKHKIEKKNNTQIKFRHIFSYLQRHNPEFFQISQWLYLLLVSIFGLNLMTILFFYCLKTIGAITTAIGVIISLILVTGIKWGMGKEEISGFKIIYIATLVIASVILGVTSNQNASQGSFSMKSFVSVLIYGIVLSFFVISSGMDRMDIQEYTILKKEPQYKIFRVFLKLGILSLFSILTFIPLLLIVRLTIPDAFIQNEITRFFIELPQIGDIIGSINGMALILGCTILPYTLYYFLSTSWPKSTSFDLWVGVLQLIEPIINLILGITVLGENFPFSWLLVIIFFMMIAIFTKYVSETQAQINVILLLKIQSQFHFEAMKYLYALKSAREIRSLIGEFDLMVEMQLNTSTSLNRLIQEKILYIPGIKTYEISLITNQNIDRTTPDQLKGVSIKKRME